MIPKRLAEIVASDLDELVTAGRGEGRTIDYKSSLPGGSDDDRREFLYDVTSLANTHGGDLIYGVEELQSEGGKNLGIPKAIAGIRIESREAVQQRLDSMMRSAIDPRIPGVALHWVPYPSEALP